MVVYHVIHPDAKCPHALEENERWKETPKEVVKDCHYHLLFSIIVITCD